MMLSCEKQVVGRDQCPRCLDNKRDNLIRYEDNGAYCFACGYYELGNGKRSFTKENTDYEVLSMHTLESILGKRGISPNTIKRYGVTFVDKEGEYSVCFPVTDVNGSEFSKHYRAVDMTTGTLTRQMKFTKGQKIRIPLFGVNQVTAKTKQVLICEGETDALIAASKLEGRTDIAVVGMVGATMAERAAMFAVRYWANKRIVLAFDNDTAGHEATENFAEVFANEDSLNVFRLSIPTEYKDLGDWLAKDSLVALAEEIANAEVIMNNGILDSEQISQSLQDYLQSLTESSFVDLRFSPTLSHAIKLMPGKLIGILGDAGSGKSTFAEHIILESITQKKRVFALSAEMSAGEVALKLMRTIRQEPLHDTNYLRSLDADYFDTICQETKRVLSWMTMVDDFGTCTMETLEGYLQQLASYGKAPDVVLIDHLLAISPSLEPNTIQETCKTLKSLATRYKCVILLICHIRKPPSESKRTIFRPPLASAYGSNGLQMYADCVLALACDNDKRLTLIETVKKERMSGVYCDVQLHYENYRLTEVDETARVETHTDYEGDTEDDTEYTEDEPTF